MGDKHHILVGITGASGAPIAIELLKSLQKNRAIALSKDQNYNTK
jgi:3-polyprenyl-4-hydroxybenzoate decarboxylase